MKNQKQGWGFNQNDTPTHWFKTTYSRKEINENNKRKPFSFYFHFSDGELSSFHFLVPRAKQRKPYSFAEILPTDNLFFPSEI